MNKLFSFSQYGDYLKCPRNYFNKHILGLVPIMTPDALTYGRECHKGFAGLAGDNPSLPEHVGIMARKFFPVYHGEKAEVKIETVLPDGTPFVFIADGVSDDHLIEMKTTGRANNLTCASHAISLQLRVGALLFGKKKAILRMIKKSQIRIKAKETQEEFDARYFAEYRDKPEEHFLEIEIPDIYRPGTINELITIHNQLKMCEKTGCWPTAAPYACYGLTACSYMDLCSDPIVNRHLYKEKTYAWL